MATTSFGDEQFDLAYPDGVEGHFWTVARNDVVHRLVVEGMHPSPVVLDLGCGRGLTVAALRKAGLECWGADSGAPAVAEELRPFVLTSQDAFALPEELRQRIDVVLLLDVLEHLPAPEEFLARCRQSFPQVTRLVVTVPARAELWSNYDEFYGHFRRYDRKSLIALLSSLEPGSVEAGYFFHLLYPVLRAQRLFGRARATRNRPPSARDLHLLLGRIFECEQRWLPASWWGTSLWARVGFSQEGEATARQRVPAVGSNLLPLPRGNISTKSERP